METINLLLIENYPEDLSLRKTVEVLPALRIHSISSLQPALDILHRIPVFLILIHQQTRNPNWVLIAESIRAVLDLSAIPLLFHGVDFGDNHLLFKGFESGPVEFIPAGAPDPILIEKVKFYARQYRDNRSLERTREGLERILESLKTEIKDRKQTEAELRASRRQFRSLGENSPDIIYTLNLDGSFAYVNPAWKKILGHSAEAVIGKYFIDFSSDADRKSFQNYFKQIRDQKKIIRDVKGTLIHQDNTPHLFDLSGAPNFDSTGNVVGMVGLLKDITQQQKLQEQLLHAQKMEAMGTLAGGVAHDFNNLLQAIQGYAELLLLNSDCNNPEYQELEEIKRTAGRGAELTRQLLTFSRKMESRLEPVDINHQVREIHKLLQRTIPKMIAFKLVLAADIDPIQADPTQIEQVLMNLCVNARDAMPDGGTLQIETAKVQMDAQSCSIHPGLTPGPYIRLTVSDTGIGMSSKTREHVFEPFFTTKQPGKGTGLGLSIVYGIIQNHGGQIHCESNPRKGTRFILYFPIPKQKQTGAAFRKSQGKPAQSQGHETVLIVDDDAYVRRIGQQILERFGYQTIGASSGEQALEIYRKKKVDLILLDLIMPGMGGIACLEQLLEINPKEKVIVITGDVTLTTKQKTILSRAGQILPKPYSTNKLLEATRMVLNTS